VIHEGGFTVRKADRSTRIGRNVQVEKKGCSVRARELADPIRRETRVPVSRFTVGEVQYHWWKTARMID